MAGRDDKVGGRLPRRLGRYILISRLVGGGMTEVYAAKLAEEVGPGRLLVIKLLPQSLKDDPEAESRFLEESRILLNLTHGNITTAFEFGRSENDRPFLVMEYVPGPSLRRLVDSTTAKNERLAIPDALFITAEVAKALSYAHSFSNPLSDGKGIIHRDISPDNIIISTTGQVKLTDFGIAQFIRTRSIGPVWGKAAYVAPELALGNPPSAASDIYSLGAVLYECLTGTPPHVGANDRETLEMAKTLPPKRPRDVRPDLPEGLCTLILSMLEKEPARRTASAAEVQVQARGILGASFAAYTEPDLSKTILDHFKIEDFLDPSPGDRLRADLLRAGIEMGEGTSTDDLLDEGTVRIGSAPVGDTAADRDAEYSKRKRATIRWISAAGVVALAISVFMLWPAREPPRSAPENPPQTAPLKTTVRETGPPPVSTTVEQDTGKAIPEPLPKRTGHRSTKTTLSGADNGKKPSRSGQDEETAAPAAETKWGWLNINSYPWSYVSVDGQKLDGHTPYRRIKLKSGSYTLIFENPELGLKTTKQVTVTAFEETNIGIRLK